MIGPASTSRLLTSSPNPSRLIAPKTRRAVRPCGQRGSRLTLPAPGPILTARARDSQRRLHIDLAASRRRCDARSTLLQKQHASEAGRGGDASEPDAARAADHGRGVCARTGHGDGGARGAAGASELLGGAGDDAEAGGEGASEARRARPALRVRGDVAAGGGTRDGTRAAGAHVFRRLAVEDGGGVAGPEG